MANIYNTQIVLITYPSESVFLKKHLALAKMMFRLEAFVNIIFHRILRVCIYQRDPGGRSLHADE